MDTSFVTGAELRYYVTEGSETGVVGNPVVDSNLEASLGSLSEVQFNFVSPNNSQSRFFSIDHASGEISSTESLDREVLCVVGVCPVNLDVAVQSATSELELVQILRVRVHVHDVNDNTPTFPSPTVKVSIPENTPVETTFPLPAATDPDTTRNNSRVTYELSPSGGLGKFGLSVVINWDGSTDIGIVVKDKLDREVVDFYQVKVIAKDGGTPSLTGTLSVNITVADSNDHTPVFVKPMWNVTISENVTFGTEVLRVSANDGDVGVNGRVTYKFNSRSASKVGSIFSMDKTTGAITVIGPVDFERSDVYHLIVEATDNGIPPKSSQSPVTINVLDVNDNPPDITFNLLAGGDHALVSEYAKPGSFVAHVSVKDLDSENTQRISCRMQSSEFSLQRMSEKEYKIILLSRLDRETVAEYNLSVTCDDNGAPSLQATNTLLVSVKDENDHSPVFQRTKYSMSIEENFPLGKSIIQISASDADVGENANVTYGFVNYREGVLSIDSSTGEIVAKDRLDREKNPTVSVHIIAVDNGEPKLTSTSLLELTLVDVNDVPPKFTKSEYQVQITENQYVHTDLRPLLVTDPDSGPGGEFYFTLLESTAPSGVFMVSQTDGSIKTVHRFDREEMDEYRLVVMATDRGDTPLSSSATVVIKIDDVNDNVPVIHYPTGINNSVHVTSWRVDTFVAAVNATDRDVKENGRLTYTIEDAEATDFLYIDERRGIIRLAFDLDERFAGSYEVTVRVKDNGQPVNSVSQTLNVLITSVNGTALETNARSSNMAIVIAVVAITVIVSLAILTGICIVRKQSENKRNQPLEVEERKIMHRRGSSSTASKTSQQSDLSTVTCLDELRKDVSFAISEDSQGRGSMAPCYLLRSQQQRPTITDPAHLEVNIFSCIFLFHFFTLECRPLIFPNLVCQVKYRTVLSVTKVCYNKNRT